MDFQIGDAPSSFPLSMQPHGIDAGIVKGFLLPSLVFVLVLFVLAFGLSYQLTIRDDKDSSIVVPQNKVSLQTRVKIADFLVNPVYYSILTYFSLMSFLELRGSMESRWFGQTSSSWWACSMYTTRMFWDLCYMKVMFGSDTKSFVLQIFHHILSVTIVGGAVWFGICHFWGTTCLMCEITTVFLSLLFGPGLFMDPDGCFKILRIVAGALLWVTFLVFRVLLFPYWLYLWYTDMLTNATMSSDAPAIPVFYKYATPFVVSFLLVLSITWFIPITKGLLKALGCGGKDHEKREATEPLLSVNDDDKLGTVRWD